MNADRERKNRAWRGRGPPAGPCPPGASRAYDGADARRKDAGTGRKIMKERFHIYMRICRQNGATTLNHPMWLRWILTGK